LELHVVEIALGAIGLSRSGAELNLDESLVRRCKGGDLEAFGLLVDRYQVRVNGFVRRMVRNQEDAEDIAQEVFVKAFRNIGRFDGRASLSTWLFKIAANLCIDRSRRRERRPEPVSFSSREGEWGEFDVPDGRHEPHTLTVSHEMEAVIESAVRAMSEKLRSVLLLHDLEGLNYNEIAEAVGVPVGTVKSRLFLARSQLQAALTDYMRGESQ
jgi:RNA polymerase sigma-70 factor (ECF subfamily)